jgi:hypothetical protein
VRFLALCVAAAAIAAPSAIGSPATDQTLTRAFVKSVDYFRSTTVGEATRQRSANGYATLTALRAKVAAQKPSTGRGRQAKTLATRGLTHMVSGFEHEVAAWTLAGQGDPGYEDELAIAFRRKTLGATFLCSAGRLLRVKVRLGAEFPCKP